MKVIELVKKTVFHYLKTGREIEVSPLPNDLKNRRAGVFTTITKNGKLRGCIGTIKPTKESLGKEIIYNTINACKDPRFNPITMDEFSDLSYEVNILKTPEEINPITDKNPKKTGIIVELENRKGVLLPNLQGITTPEKQLEIALKKAGINPSSDYKIYKFETEIYEGS